VISGVAVNDSAQMATTISRLGVGVRATGFVVLTSSLITMRLSARCSASLPVYAFGLFGAGEGVPPFKPC
jgi:hypothetical protein